MDAPTKRLYQIPKNTVVVQGTGRQKYGTQCGLTHIERN